MAEPDPDVAAVIDLELRLHEPEVRRNRDALLALLHPEFSEFGASGRVYDRDAIVDAIASAQGGVQASDFRATRLGPEAILLTYRTDTPSLRTSIWVRHDGRWLVLHHQGTPT